MKDHLTRNPHRIDTFFTHTHLSSLVGGQTHTKWITLALWMGTTHGLQLECSMECDDMIWAGMFTGPVTMVTCCPLAVCHCWHWNNVSCCQLLRSSIIYLVISWKFKLSVTYPLHQNWCPFSWLWHTGKKLWWTQQPNKSVMKNYPLQNTSWFSLH